ncbi:N-acetyltransferase [Shewanella gelidimarina]|uniref:GNAT family N-acetyltransferase n=1 Tax=Shewanella gelidimarina TaxID=56813 RepID=UPI00200C5B75|nr:GNAT family N-acetyltransferase [Shewanella gelidimarina]MCL1059376.1 N-acetyltransferase [Shewanella gelidimarina]
MSEHVIHLVDENRFVVNVNNTQAVLCYAMVNDPNVISGSGRCNFSSTFVPNELRGKGLAEKLVRHGLSWAKSQGLQVEASCWYVQKFLTST